MNQEQILEEIRNALAGDAGPEDALSIPEMARLIVDRHGGSVEMMRRRLREVMPDLLRSGVFQRVFVRREAIDGRNAKVPAYRLAA